MSLRTDETAADAIVLPDDEPALPFWRRLWPEFLLAVLLWATFILKLHNLDHTALTRWDEAYHAVVAQNVYKHPLRPTLIDEPYLPYDYTKWGENHFWLHKPIVPFWQIALSFALFGVNTFALRLPAAILSTLAAGVTYLLGKELVGRGAAFIAAALQALNPFLMSLIHGYQFADNIDIALLFWVELGLYFVVGALRTGSWRDICLAGIAQGLAFLSKSYLAGIVFGVALAAWLLPLCRLVPREEVRGLSAVRLLALLGVTTLTVSPWLIYCAAAFPQEFQHEHGQVLRHLSANVEGWGAPWDRLVFDYLIAMYGVFYTPILVAAAVLVGPTFMRGRLGPWLLYAWGVGAVLPHVFAATKTPSMTVTAMPALFLLLGCLIAEAWQGRAHALAALAAVLAMGLISPAVIKEPGYGYPHSDRFGAIMRQALWVIEHVAVAVGAAVVGAFCCWLVKGKLPVSCRRGIRWTTLAFCIGALAWLTWRDVQAAWRVTAKDVNDRYSLTAGEFARNCLPQNAVLLCHETKPGEHLSIMFYAGRTCYPVTTRNVDARAQAIIEAGGAPYIVSPWELPLPLVHEAGGNGPRIYRWR